MPERSPLVDLLNKNLLTSEANELIQATELTMFEIKASKLGKMFTLGS